jgi:tetratricopeptide (TPR) repeat protein
MKVLFLLPFCISFLFSSDSFENIKSNYFKSYDYEQVEKYEESIKSLAPLYKKYPNGYTLNLRLGWLFYLQKKYNSSLEHYNKASLISTYSLEPKLGMMRVYLSQYSYEKVENLATELLKIDYYNYYANLYMVQTLYAQGKYDVAENITKKILTIYPTDILFLEQLLLIYKHTKNVYYQDIYESILILDPNNVFVHTLD